MSGHGASSGHGSDHGDDDDYHKVDNHGGHEEEEGEGPWLMSFADMVTLLMCFFILFFSVDKGNVEVDAPERLKEKLKKGSVKNPAISEESFEMPPVPFVGPTSDDMPRAKAISQEFTELLQRLDVVSMVNIVGPNTVEVVLLNVHFFKTGDATGTKAGEKSIVEMAKSLKGLPQGTIIEVEGHTDADRIATSKYATNWELSAARAAWVVRKVAEAGVDPKLMKASGFAEFRPLAPERDDRGFPIIPNKALNRRIVIRMRLPQGAPVEKSDGGSKK